MAENNHALCLRVSERAYATLIYCSTKHMEVDTTVIGRWKQVEGNRHDPSLEVTKDLEQSWRKDKTDWEEFCKRIERECDHLELMDSLVSTRHTTPALVVQGEQNRLPWHTQKGMLFIENGIEKRDPYCFIMRISFLRKIKIKNGKNANRSRVMVCPSFRFRNRMNLLFF